MQNYPPAVISQKLCEHGKNGDLWELKTVVKFTIVSITRSVYFSKMWMDEVVAQGNAAINQINICCHCSSTGLANDSVPVYNNIKPITVTWGPFLQKM